MLNTLNAPQHAAVTAPPGNILVLAGAGSGKTRVLVQRIAWLVQNHYVSPFDIMAVTFTNKAAAEMRGRVESLLEMPAVGHSLWVGTFHGLAHRLLRLHWQEAKLSKDFQILDSDDQKRLVKRIIAAMNLDEKQWPAKQAQWFINAQKDQGLRAKHMDAQGNPRTKILIQIYHNYEQACQSSGLVDFGELLLKTQEVLSQCPDLLQHYQQRFRHILVDEFQDTNAIQYAFIRLLTGESGCIMAVGDDDQSIYGWRGAKIENIHTFHQDFPNAQTIRLEQNYRSSGTILEAANALISNNSGRLGKNLWTEDGAGELISLYSGFNDIDESRFIIERIREWVAQGNLRREAAILYRSNAQSRVLEETLIQFGIPYRIYGGLRFFDRAEIKDALGYLKLVANPHDDTAFERVINTPTRGIGDQTLNAIREHAKDHEVSLWTAASQITNFPKVTYFLSLISQMITETTEMNLGDQVDHIVQNSGLLAYFGKEKGEKAQARMENLEELINAARQFEVPPDTGVSLLTTFLAHAALESGENQGERFEDCVQLMTLHAAKGLEFPLVFLSGVEEGLFPHPLSSEDPDKLEEERRLCYVGMTRAMRKLYITYAESRRLHGSDNYHRASRFIKEIPEELVEEVRVRTKVSRPTGFESKSYGKTDFTRSFKAPQSTQAHSSGFHIGQTVQHPKFGEGTILALDGQGAQTRIHINFYHAGSKWLVLGYAKLESI
ncbi:MAG: DNA helicase II [Gammaproteobacteria bacterium]